MKCSSVLSLLSCMLVCNAVHGLPAIPDETANGAAPLLPDEPSARQVNAQPVEVPECRDYDTNFAEESYGWVSENSARDTFEQSPLGIQMNLVPPMEYVPMLDLETNLPFNKYMGRGPTFNATTFMRFGKVSITMRTSKVPGSITAFILISNTGDEIDFEMIGGDGHQIQTNYFYSGEALYTVNGGFHTVKGSNLYDEMHTYTIDWQPEKIIWSVDGNVIREQNKKDTCKDGKCRFPDSPSRVQIGLWDGSFESGTAYWSRGPINWADQTEKISSLISKVTIECNPETNKLIT